MMKPRTRQSNGAAQLSLLPEPPFCPKFPNPNSPEAAALLALLEGELTQVDWLKRGKGWRLAAQIKELDYLGWEPESILLKREGWPRPIAVYQLPVKAKRLVKKLQSRGAL
jgi:hypothetical protein